MRKWILGAAIVTAAYGPALACRADASGDREAAQAIAEHMKASGKLKDYRVGVKYQDGVAWLSGTVTSAAQKQIAEQIVRDAEGVEAVVNKLEVAAPTPVEAQLSEVRPAAAQMPAPQQPGGLRSGRAGRSGNNMPLPLARTMQADVQQAGYGQYAGPGGGMAPMAMSQAPVAGGQTVSYDNPQMPGYAWPSYAAYPNYAAVTYPQQYSPTAWPYIGPFYPYPQVPLGWRKVTLEWDDGWWWLDFKDCKDCH